MKATCNSNQNRREKSWIDRIGGEREMKHTKKGEEGIRGDFLK